MKKIITFIFGLVALFALASCTVQSTTTIEFTSLPQAVYQANEEDVDAVKQAIKVTVSNISGEIDLTHPDLIVSGLDETTLSTAGNYVLIVQYKSASVSFSYTVVDNTVEATVNDEATLKTALESADVNVIKLAGSFTVENGYEITRSLSIYGNGHTITSKGVYGDSSTNDRIFNIQGSQDKKLSNLKVNFYDIELKLKDAAPGNTRGISIYCTENVEITLDNVKLTNATYPFNIASYNEGLVVNINNSYIEGGCALNIWSNNSQINVKDSTLISNWESSLLGGSFGAIVLNGGDRDFDNIGVVAGDTGQNNKITIENTEIEANKLAQANTYILTVQDACAGNEINFVDCSLKYEEGCLYKPDNLVPAANKFYIDGERQ